MFVNFCSKLAFRKFNRLAFIITKDGTLSHAAARESLPKCFQLFQTAPNQTEQFGKISVGPLGRGAEPVYRPEFEGCLPLKCDFFIFFAKTSFYVVFCVWQPAFIEQTLHQTLVFSTFDFVVTALFDN